LSGPEILLTGGAGQIGSAFRRLAPSTWRVAAPGNEELNLSNPAAVAATVASRPWVAVLNCAAYTDVDRAESDVVTAWQVNALGPAALAQATALADIPLIHLSTDYVFDGRKAGAYVEDDAVGPLSVYGASKEAGEQAVRTANPRHVILRTAWVVSPHGRNFVRTMLRLADERRPLARVVDDQLGCPTSAADIAGALVSLVERQRQDRASPVGDYHFVNGGEASWCALARFVFERLAARGRTVPALEAIGAADYPTAARRPGNSRLSTEKWTRDFGFVARPWQNAVGEVVDSILDDG